jgi:DNA topoisomerase-1
MQDQNLPDPAQDPAAAAKVAKLRYVSDAKPGITRYAKGTVFGYRNAAGRAIRDAADLARIKKLAIPPAWKDVWICPDPNGHIQAVGRDDRGRKQYRYHPRWRAVRDEAKYGRLLMFGRVLPGIRERVEADLAKPGMPREKVLAAVVRLLETTLIRVGNSEYAKQNRSYGLTTIRNSHARVDGSRIVFDFRGKAGIQHNVELKDARLARIVRKCRELPGQELFTYLGEDGEAHDVGSDDVNEYLREISGEELTAKDFRTWAATNLAAIALREFEAVDSEAKAKRHIRRAVEAVAKMLGNTPTICRKCYIHPAVFEGYIDGTLAESLRQRADKEMRERLERLKPEEAAVLAFLRHRLEDASIGNGLRVSPGHAGAKPAKRRRRARGTRRAR